MSLAKEMSALFRELEKNHGCRCVRGARSGHVKIHLPSGDVVYAANTPSDKRAILNTKGELRRRGINIR